MKRPTVKDLAQHTKLSPATIDRVLHERGGVRDATRRKVQEAIHALGFGKLPVSLSDIPRPDLRFLVLLPKFKTGFVRRLEAGLSAAPETVRHARLSLEVRGVHLTEDDMGEHLQDVAGFDGIAMFATDTPPIQAQIDRIAAMGLPLVTLVSDCPGARRLAHFGIDNRAAGRTAGRLMGRFLGARGGSVGVLSGGDTLRDHEERLAGFAEILGRDYPELELLPAATTFSDARRNRHAVVEMVRACEDLIGLYSIGGGNSGVVAGLTDLQAAGRLVVIAHELTGSTQSALLRRDIDAVLDQNPDEIARRALRALTAYALKDISAPEEVHLPIQVYFAENLP